MLLKAVITNTLVAGHCPVAIAHKGASQFKRHIIFHSSLPHAIMKMCWTFKFDTIKQLHTRAKNRHTSLNQMNTLYTSSTGRLNHSATLRLCMIQSKLLRNELSVHITLHYAYRSATSESTHTCLLLLLLYLPHLLRLCVRIWWGVLL